MAHFPFDIASAYEEDLHFYQEQLFSKALDILERLHANTDEHLYRLYSERCRNYIAQPPAKDWAANHDYNP